MSDTPIAEHAFLSDCHGAALVDRAGSVEWWCPGRFDAPSVFGRLLDPGAGHLRLGPVGSATVTRRYLEDTLVLETTSTTAGGVLVVTDALLMAEGVRSHQLGAGSPHVLARRARCQRGEVEVEIEFAPRPEYGLTTPVLHPVTGGVATRGGPSRLRLSGAAPWTIDGGVATARVVLTAGQDLCLAVAHANADDDDLPPGWDQDHIAAHLDDTIEAWRSWQAEHQGYDGPYRELVRHSSRVLQGLTYQPTGAMVAAATTSLPEVVGGERNWDYRYTWVRDASFALDALWVAACPDEADVFLDFLITASASFDAEEDLQIMFGVGGERDLTERHLDLEGWRGSRPVRVGNGAWDQRQLDVYGELLAAMHRLREYLSDLAPDQRRFLATLADIAAARWQEADQGIWELRGEPRHFLHSKLMCWVALDRAVDLAPLLGAEDRVEGWAATRDEIRLAIDDRGWDAELGSYTQAFDSSELDASNLVLSIVGYLPGDHERVLGTIAATEAHLTDGQGLVRRYRSVDGLDGEEGAFLLCTFWLAEALARSGRPDRAREVFERAIGHASDLGLLAEEIDPASGEQLGNYPQAFSHIGLVNAAWAIAEAERGHPDAHPHDEAG